MLARKARETCEALQSSSPKISVKMSDDEDQTYGTRTSYTAPQDILDEHAQEAEDEGVPDAFEATARSKQVAARQGDYQLRRFNRTDGLGEGEDESYEDRMRRVTSKRRRSESGSSRSRRRRRRRRPQTKRAECSVTRPLLVG